VLPVFGLVFGLRTGLPENLGGVIPVFLPTLTGVFSKLGTSAGATFIILRGTGALGSAIVPAAPGFSSTYLRLRGIDFPFFTWMR